MIKFSVIHSTQRLTRLLGTAKALDLILLGQTYDPDKALELGVVSRLLPKEGFMAAVMEFVVMLSIRTPRALAHAKRAIREGAKYHLSKA